MRENAKQNIEKKLLNVPAAAFVPCRRMRAEDVSRDNEDPARICTSSLPAPSAAQMSDLSLGIGGKEATFTNIAIAISGDVLASRSSGHKPLCLRKD